MRLLCVGAVLLLVSVTACEGAGADSIAILRQGFLGAGTGAVASAMSGGKGDRVWQGALAGAGVMVVGGALLDVLAGDNAGTVTYVREVRPVTVVAPKRIVRPESAYRRVYKQGFRNGYRQGYQDGYEDAYNELYW